MDVLCLGLLSKLQNVIEESLTASGIPKDDIQKVSLVYILSYIVRNCM